MSSTVEIQVRGPFDPAELARRLGQAFQVPPQGGFEHDGSPWWRLAWGGLGLEIGPIDITAPRGQAPDPDGIFGPDPGPPLPALGGATATLHIDVRFRDREAELGLLWSSFLPLLTGLGAEAVWMAVNLGEAWACWEEAPGRAHPDTPWNEER